MIEFTKHTLSNGLRLLVHEDFSTPMVAVNIAYHVGSVNDDPERTGFAHLFEHLMFGGSANAPDFDGVLQNAGGDSNAFTNNDFTNYYDILPAENIETALWLEADRMEALLLNKKALDNERKVVIEEFQETCLNQPYGDLWHHLMDLTYKKHSYRWPVIGLEPKHIEEATLKDVSAFFKKYYSPQNAVLVIAGKIKSETALELVEKYFGHIKNKPSKPTDLPTEPPQNELRRKHVKSDVPVDALVMAYHTPDRLSSDYYACDLLSDVLAYGRSSRLYQRLIKIDKLLSEVDCYLTGTNDIGLFVVEGKLAEGVRYEDAEKVIREELALVCNDLIDDRELQKLKNRTESNLVFGEIGVLNRAQNLAYFEILGNADLINHEADAYQAITSDEIREVARRIIRDENCNILYYGK